MLQRRRKRYIFVECETPKKPAAADIIDAIKTSTPRTKETLKNEGVLLTPDTKAAMKVNHNIVQKVHATLKELKANRTSADRTRYKWFASRIAKNPADDNKMRRRLGMQFHYWVCASTYEEEEQAQRDQMHFKTMKRLTSSNYILRSLIICDVKARCQNHKFRKL